MIDLVTRLANSHAVKLSQWEKLPPMFRRGQIETLAFTLKNK
jgi:hypothetical protein